MAKNQEGSWRSWSPKNEGSSEREGRNWRRWYANIDLGLLMCQVPTRFIYKVFNPHKSLWGIYYSCPSLQMKLTVQLLSHVRLFVTPWTEDQITCPRTHSQYKEEVGFISRLTGLRASVFIFFVLSNFIFPRSLCVDSLCLSGYKLNMLVWQE